MVVHGNIKIIINETYAFIFVIDHKFEFVRNNLKSKFSQKIFHFTNVINPIKLRFFDPADLFIDIPAPRG